MLPLLQGAELVRAAQMELMERVSPIESVVDRQWRRVYHSLEVEGEGETATFNEASRGFSVAKRGGLPPMVDNPLETEIVACHSKEVLPMPQGR